MQAGLHDEASGVTVGINKATGFIANKKCDLMSGKRVIDKSGDLPA